MNGKSLFGLLAAIISLGFSACGVFDGSSSSTPASTSPSSVTNSDCSGVTLASTWGNAATTWAASPVASTVNLYPTVAFGTGTVGAITISGATTSAATGVTPTYSWTTAATGTSTAYNLVIQKKGSVSGASTYSEVYLVQTTPATTRATFTSPAVHGALPTTSPTGQASIVVATEPVLGVGDYRVLVLGSDNITWGCRNFTVQ